MRNKLKYSYYGGESGVFYLSANSDLNFYIWKLNKNDSTPILVQNYSGFIAMSQSIVKNDFIYLLFSNRLEKRNLDFSLIWTYSTPSGVSAFAMDVDDDGSVYITGLSGTRDGDVRRINSNGSLVWATIHGHIGRAITIQGDYVYKAGDRQFTPVNSVHKINKSNGSLVWGAGFTSSSMIRVDSFGNTYNLDLDNRLYKRRASDGVLLGTLDLATFLSFNIFNDVLYVTTSNSFRTYNLSFGLLQTVVSPTILVGMNIFNDFIYCMDSSGASAFINTMYKVNPNDLTITTLGLLGNDRNINYFNKNNTIQVIEL